MSSQQSVYNYILWQINNNTYIFCTRIKYICSWLTNFDYKVFFLLNFQIYCYSCSILIFKIDILLLYYSTFSSFFFFVFVYFIHEITYIFLVNFRIQEYIIFISFEKLFHYWILHVYFWIIFYDFIYMNFKFFFLLFFDINLYILMQNFFYINITYWITVYYYYYLLTFKIKKGKKGGAEYLLMI